MRCQKCKAYVNPFMRFLDGGRKMQARSRPRPAVPALTISALTAPALLLLPLLVRPCAPRSLWEFSLSLPACASCLLGMLVHGLGQPSPCEDRRWRKEPSAGWERRRGAGGLGAWGLTPCPQPRPCPARLQCNFCGHVGDVPPDYFCHLGPDGQRRDKYERPELCKG